VAAKVMANRAFDNDMISGDAVRVFEKIKNCWGETQMH
jgi:hypothetical protein